MSGPPSELEVRQVVDESAIRNLLHRMAQLADGGRVDDFVSCWTEDASWEVPGEVHRGHDAIRARVVAARGDGSVGPGTHHRHLIVSQVIEVDGSDTATSEQYMVLLADTTTRPGIAVVQHHRNTLRRDATGWKLARRITTPG